MTTDGEPGDLELKGATISDEAMGALLHAEDADERVGDGVVYARNQDGVMVEVMLDMDSQTPIVREIEMTPEGVVYLNPSDELADNATLKP